MATLDRAEDHSESLTTAEEKSHEFKRLAEKLDSKLSTAIQQTLEIGPIHTTLLEELTKLKLVPVGSTQDGSKVNTPYDFGDVDIILIETEKVLSEPLFRYVKNHPASLWVLGKNEKHAKYFKNITLIEGQYVPVSVLRHIKKDINEKIKAVINRKVQHGAYISEDRINTIEQSKVGYKYESRPTGEDKEDTEEKEAEFDKCLSADIVPALSFEEWPFTAEEWINRKREWPSKEVVNQVIDMGCQIIAKRPLDTGTNANIPEFIERDTEANQRVENASDKQTDENNSCEPPSFVNNADKVRENSDEENEKDGYFSLSFSQCESILVESLSGLQVLCWRVLKSYQKAYFETEPQVLKSYHWKTVVFWVVEETKPIFWNEDNFMNAVLKMLDRMTDCLQKRFLPLYFVRMQNLITATSEYAIEKTIEKIHQIREKPFESLHQFLENPPTPVILIPKKQPAKLPEKAKPKPVTLMDCMNEHLNDTRLFSGNTQEVIDLLKNDARLLSKYEQVVIDLYQEALSPDNSKGFIQIKHENPPVPNFVMEMPESRLFSKGEQGIIDLLKETLSQANNRRPIQIEHKNTRAQTCATEIPKNQQSSTEKQYEQTEFNVKQTFDDASRKLTMSSNSEDMSNTYHFNNVIPDSEIPILESLLQLVGEGVKMLAGGERSAAYPEFGRTLVRLMKQNQNPETSAPNNTQSPFDLGAMRANMEKAIEEFIKNKEQIQKYQCNNEIPDSESPSLESILQSARESLTTPDGGDTSVADPEFGRTIVELMKQNQNPDWNMMDDMEVLMAEYMNM